MEFLEGIHLSGNWQDLVPWGRRRNPVASGSSGPLCPPLRPTTGPLGQATDAPMSLHSSGPTELLAIPRTHPALSHLKALFPGMFPSGMSFPHLLKSFLFKVPALMPAPPGSLHQGFCMCLYTPLTTILSLSKVCPGLPPWPGNMQEN